MKWKGWQTRPRWEYEKTRRVVVFAADAEVSNQQPDVVEYLQELLREFSIPLDVTDGNSEYSEDLPEIEALLRASIKGNENKIDYERFEQKLRKTRDEGKLPYGMVILIDKDKHEFYDPPEQGDQAIYGIGVPDGLVILRYTHKESVRHEFGHMLGLAHHHPKKPGCIMNWECSTAVFCDVCKRQIEEMWREEIGKA